MVQVFVNSNKNAHKIEIDIGRSQTIIENGIVMLKDPKYNDF